MKKFISILLALTLVFASSSMICFAANEAHVYYIDSIDGNDANSGTSADDAVKTIAGLKNLVVEAGTKFLFRNGL